MNNNHVVSDATRQEMRWTSRRLSQKKSRLAGGLFTAAIAVVVNIFLIQQVFRGFSMTTDTSRLITAITGNSNTTSSSSSSVTTSAFISLVEENMLLNSLLLSSSSSTVSTPTPASATSSTTATTITAGPRLFEGQPFKDVLCPGCRESTSTRLGKRETCQSLIYKQLKKSNNNLTHATEMVLAKLGPADECSTRCHPDACSQADKDYWRPDQASPREVHAATLYLPSIPAIHRVPNPNHVNLTDYFLSNKSHVHPARSYFFEYNPSIVQLPSSQIPRDVLTEQEANEAVYLASFRVTNLQQCIHGGDELLMIGGSWPRPKQKDYLGLALLRSDLSIITDVVIDNKRKDSAMRKMEDYRLFHLGDNDQLYVASYNQIIPIWLVPPTTNDKDKTLTLAENRFPSKLSVYSRNYISCVGQGKNIQFFDDDHRKNGTATIAELFPMKGKQIVNLTKPCSGSSEPAYVKNNKTLPVKSFGSYDQVHFFKHGAFSTLSDERGSTCCVRIRDPQSMSNANATHKKELLLGISHSKTKFRSRATRHSLPGNVSANQFFSAFYAFEPHEPYTVRARSGSFCLGFPTVNETMSTEMGGGNPYGRNNMGKLALGGEDYDCPMIHFVSGMVEKADDPSRIIIAYGVQDCAPRFIELEKEQVLQMLFPASFRQE